MKGDRRETQVKTAKTGILPKLLRQIALEPASPSGKSCNDGAVFGNLASLASVPARPVSGTASRGHAIHRPKIGPRPVRQSRARASCPITLRPALPPTNPRSAKPNAPRLVASKR